MHTDNRSTVSIYNCLFFNTYAWACGGASLTEGGRTAHFDRCTIYGNKSDNLIGNQGGSGVANTGTVNVRNCILWANTGMQIAAYGSYYGEQSTINVSYCCVLGGVAANGAGHFTDGGGNITGLPGFYSIPKWDFRFPTTSPCFEKGHPSDYDPNGRRATMGHNFARTRPLLPAPPFWECVVTLDANGDESRVASVSRNHGDQLGQLPVPLREDYDFLGWYTAATGGERVTT